MASVLHVDPAELAERLSFAGGDPASALDGAAALVVDAAAGSPPLAWSPGSIPVVIVGVTGDPAGVDSAPYDVLLTPDDPFLGSLLDQVGWHPIAAAALAVLLRDTEHRSVDAGLAAESAVYSMLQAGPEFGAWLRERAGATVPPDVEPTVLVERLGDELRVVLNRPHRHNAVTAALRDALAEALALATVDDTIRTVRLSGNGPSFCSGGDLAEFGSLPDPATAHVTRLVRSPARLAHAVSERLQVHLHGACMGAGIELPAFASHVVAAEDTVIALPELGLGLIPGAGGTVSIPRRIGRHRTAALALSGAQIDAPTALEWGLIDELAPPR